MVDMLVQRLLAASDFALSDRLTTVIRTDQQPHQFSLGLPGTKYFRIDLPLHCPLNTTFTPNFTFPSTTSEHE